ncbi:hypothetical protein FGG08_003707 [Glutinoglossum americanum]|uniref:S-adenosyl-L-methionine-dependent methyltransferase n=1 Tax=Glutinoglossum americanum TaxID=1670608 RepID=A0A9P8KXT3_9PEZI|nr:hypothetical protein FGG08_003707 [Glutinoglossum americanum]
MAHHIFVVATGGKLHLAPISNNPQRILDIGTGTGIWAMEMVDDVEKRWMYNEPFDYIHCRSMSKSIGDWPNLIRQCYKFTKPHGYVEFQDIDLQYHSHDNSLLPTHSLHRWNADLIKAANIAGREPSPGPKLEGWIRAAGFQNVVHEMFVLPLGPWPKEPKLVGYPMYFGRVALDGDVLTEF